MIWLILVQTLWSVFGWGFAFYYARKLNIIHGALQVVFEAANKKLEEANE